MQDVTRAQRPVDHVRPLPDSVISRCADTDSAHGITTDPYELVQQDGGAW